ncbi:MAG: hypothetical protein RIR70_187 [Pseudomonadota bacterium]|jgi:ribosomal subunit interface protein
MELDIRAKGFELTAAIEQHIRRRLQFALDWARHGIGRVTVRLSDENGPRGGLDKRCAIVVSLPAQSELVIEDTRDDIYRAIDHAVERLGRNLAKRLARSRAHAKIRPALVLS